MGFRSDDLAARAQLLKKRSEAEEKKAREEIAAEAKVARDRWKRLADEKKWNEVKMPLSCYRFGTKVDSDPRASPEHVQAVLSAVGLADRKNPAYAHLGPSDHKALIEVVSRNASAFWVDAGPTSTTSSPPGALCGATPFA